MAICNLLSLTVRKNQNYEPEAMTTNQVYTGAVSSAVTSPATVQTDSVSLSGRVMDIMGNLTDEQIEAVLKVGYSKAVNDMVEIITTCKDITDEELISLYLGDPNKQVDSSKTRLRIVRNTSAVDAKNKIATTANEAETNANEAYDALIKAQGEIKTSKTAENDSNDNTKTQADREKAENDAVDKANEAKKQAQAAKDAAATARSKAQEVISATNKSQESLDKANSAVELLDGGKQDKPIKTLNNVLDETNNDKYEEAGALEKAADEILAAAEEVIKTLGEKVALRLAQQAYDAAKNAASANDTQTAKDYAKDARELAQQARDAIKDSTNADKVKEVNSIADGADALSYAVEAELKMKEAQTSITNAKSANPADETLAKEAIKQSKDAVDLAEKARKAAAKVDESVVSGKTLKDMALEKVGLYDTDGTTVLVNGSIVLLDGSSTGTIEDAKAEIFAEFGPGTNFPDIDPDDLDGDDGAEQEEEDTPTPGPSKPADSDVNVTMMKRQTSGSEKNKQTISIDATVKNIKLTDPILGKEYYYQISSLSSTQNITLEYLDNGRFLIVGDYVKVVAIDGQNDDIILIGSYCELDTNSGDDKVRLGGVIDSVLSEEKQADGNKVTTGSGKDYVLTFGINDIDLGGGTNTIKYSGGTISEYLDAGAIEKGATYVWDDRGGGIGTSDGKLGTAGQGSYGDCKFLSFLNSFKLYLEKNPSKKLSDYVEISGSSAPYTVKFKGSGKTVTVNASELANQVSALEKLLIKSSAGGTTTGKQDKNNLSGDIDNVIVEIAFRKLIREASNNSNSKIYNIDNSEDNEYDSSLGGYTYNVKEDGSSSYYGTDYSAHNNQMFGTALSNWLVSEHLFGTSDAGFVVDGNGMSFENSFKYMLDKFKAGKVSNLVVGTSSAADSDTAHKLGPYQGHAYCVKNGESGKWVELCNPWDSNDSFVLEWDQFLTYYSSLHLFGDAYDVCFDGGFSIAKVDSTIDPSSSSVPVVHKDSSGVISEVYTTIDLNTLFYAGADYSEAHPNIFANIFRNEEPTIYDEIDEITASIENVKEILDEKKTFELFS